MDENELERLSNITLVQKLKKRNRTFIAVHATGTFMTSQSLILT
jgi:hypothetical protein